MSNHFTIETTNNIALYWIVILSGFITGICFMIIFDPVIAWGETNTTTILQQHYNGVYGILMNDYVTYIKYFGVY